MIHARLFAKHGATKAWSADERMEMENISRVDNQQDRRLSLRRRRMIEDERRLRRVTRRAGVDLT